MHDTNRDPRHDPEAGDVLIHRSTTRVIVTKRGAYGVYGYTEGPGRPDGGFITGLQGWAKWLWDGQVVAMSLPRGLRGVAGLVINPKERRWGSTPCDESCDLCAYEVVPFHDMLQCPHDSCHWIVQVCDRCGGFDEARHLMELHQGECAVARDSESRYDATRCQLVAPDRQLSLFGAAQ